MAQNEKSKLMYLPSFRLNLLKFYAFPFPKTEQDNRRMGLGGVNTIITNYQYQVIN